VKKTGTVLNSVSWGGKTAGGNENRYMAEQITRSLNASEGVILKETGGEVVDDQDAEQMIDYFAGKKGGDSLK